MMKNWMPRTAVTDQIPPETAVVVKILVVVKKQKTKTKHICVYSSGSLYL